jgi:hypothetical protein
MNAREAAAAIRLDLRNAGYRTRDISVQLVRGSNTVNVTVRRLGLVLAEVAAIAKRYEAIAQDQLTGELLHGGLHVEVRIAREALEPLAAQARGPIGALKLADVARFGSLARVVRVGEYEYRVEAIDKSAPPYPSASIDSAAITVALMFARRGHTSFDR